VAVQALAVLAGRARHVAESIAAQAGACGLADDRRTGVEACVRYLTNNTECLRYDQALASGWPIATEVVEGACRHLIGDRLGITGSRWSVEGAEAILRLPAPRGARLYPRFNREELGRRFLGLMPNLNSKEGGDNSMAGNQRPCPGVWNGALRGPCDIGES